MKLVINITNVKNWLKNKIVNSNQFSVVCYMLGCYVNFTTSF